MNTYKITNITNLIGKRGFKSNSELEIQYVDSMIKKTIKIKPADSVYLTVRSLPMSVHKLRVKGLVSVSEISATELVKIMEAKKPKIAVMPTNIEEKEVVVEVKKSTKKKNEKE